MALLAAGFPFRDSNRFLRNVNGENIAGNNLSINGNNNTIFGNNNVINGDNNKISGNNNTICGNNLHIQGNNCDITGNNNYITGNNSNLRGNNSLIWGHNNHVIGDNNGITGNNNNVDGINASLRGNNNNVVRRNVNTTGQNSWSNAQNPRIYERRTPSNIPRFFAVNNGTMYTNVPPEAIVIDSNFMGFGNASENPFFHNYPPIPPVNSHTEGRDEDVFEETEASEEGFVAEIRQELTVEDLPSYTADKTRDIVCEICIDGVVEGEEVRILPCCHQFHKNCVDPWLRNSFTCPSCQINFRS